METTKELQELIKEIQRLEDTVKSLNTINLKLRDENDLLKLQNKNYLNTLSLLSE